jgi:hypothetical protein
LDDFLISAKASASLLSWRILCGMFWRALFDEIRLDIPKQRLRKQLSRVEDAINARLEEISNSPLHARERVAIEQTLAEIRRIQVEKLGFPETASK